MKSLFSPPRPFLNKEFHQHLNEKEGINCTNMVTKKLTLQDYGFIFKYGEKSTRFKEIQKETNFKFIKNDNQYQTLVYLLAAKNLFNFELEKMEENYISRLVFNPNHETLILLFEGEVIGGICFRLFEKFAEIVFCVVGSKFHTKGYGSYMMSVFKGKMQSIGIYDIFTYADDTALVFFHRHGFSLYSHIAKSDWEGRLKDYTNATLLSCHIDENTDYINIHSVIDNNIRLLENELGESKVYTISSWPVRKIGGVIISKTNGGNARDNIRAALMRIRMNPKCEMFMKQPPLECPEEEEIIKNSIDLTKLTNNVRKNKYKSFNAFAQDLVRVFEPCIKYMPLENAYTSAARELINEANNIINSYKI